MSSINYKASCTPCCSPEFYSCFIHILTWLVILSFKMFSLCFLAFIYLHIYIKKKILPSCWWGAFHLILLCPYACVGLARFFWPPNEWSCMTSGFRGYCAFVCFCHFFPMLMHMVVFFVVSLHYCFEFHGIKYVQNSIPQQLHPLPPSRLSSFLHIFFW